MGKGSTQFQHLVQTEVPPKLLAGWLGRWCRTHDLPVELAVELRPHTAGSDLLELSVRDVSGNKMANVIFTNIKDRRGRSFLSVRDQNTFDPALRRKRLMTLLHLFLIHRYKAVSVHYVTPSEDNRYQTQKMQCHGIYERVYDEIGEIIVAEVNPARIAELIAEDGVRLQRLIDKSEPASTG